MIKTSFGRKSSLMRDQRGATALEFSFVLPLLLAFFLAIFDVSAYFFVSGQMQYGLETAARKLRVGTSTYIGNTATQRNAFRTLVCNSMQTGLISTCTTNLAVDVRPMTSFGSVSYPANPDSNGNGTVEDSETSYDSGGASCPIIARAFYNYRTIVPYLGTAFAAIIPGTKTISVATAFRNEPFSGGSGAACAGY